jgi:ribosomal protein S18 acetylase RimI-like enzyme
MNIRLLNESDSPAYQVLRLRALKNDPGSFGSTYEQEVVRPLEAFSNRIQHTENQFTLGCFDNSDSLMGIVHFAREDRLKTAHKGNVYGMYVDPEFRGQGIGRCLLVALIERAIRDCDGLEQIHLVVVSNNEPAKRLYAALGFEVYGVEPHALKHDGQYFDEDLMILKLSNSDESGRILSRSDL